MTLGKTKKGIPFFVGKEENWTFLLFDLQLSYSAVSKSLALFGSMPTICLCLHIHILNSLKEVINKNWLIWNFPVFFLRVSDSCLIMN